MHKVRANIPEAIEIIKQGGMIILVDDEDRENEGDLVVASSFITQENLNFMLKYGKGLVCVSLPAERCDELGLTPMAIDNTCRFGTGFTTSVNLNGLVGVSAKDRAATIKALIDRQISPNRFSSQGFVFPIRARNGGVLVRPGQTEGSSDFAKLAGLYPSGVICEIMAEDGSMMRMPDLRIFAEQHNLKIVTVADLIKYRLEHENIVEEVEVEAKMPTGHGSFKIRGFENTADGRQAVALIKGDILPNVPILCRVHSQCLMGDIFLADNCKCAEKLHGALDTIENNNSGVLLYIYRDTAIPGFLSTPEARLGGKHTHNDDNQAYGFGAICLSKLGIKKVHLLNESQKTHKFLSSYGLEVV